MKSTIVALLVLTASIPVAVTPAAATPVDNDPPLADAGLDQTVVQGTTVLLDGTGSRDPDGSIESYAWSIETPDGTTTVPDCVDCPHTSFEPTQTGVYSVTLRVRDDDGATSTDTLYVTVENGQRPTVALRGPPSADVDEQVTYEATARSGSAPLERLVWVVDGSIESTQEVVGGKATVTLSRNFSTPGAHTVRIVAVDDIGLRRSKVTTTEVVDTGGDGNGTTTPTPTPTSTTTTGPPTATPTTGPPPATTTVPSPTTTTGSPTTAPGSTTSTPGTTTSAGTSTPTAVPTTTARPPTTVPVTTTTGGNGPGPISEQASPTVAGKQVLTGTPPFGDQYSLVMDVPQRKIAQIQWWTDGVWTDSGQTTTAQWSPGRHDLAARVRYVDGSTDVATFSDGSRTVVADPKPTIGLTRKSKPIGVGGIVDVRDGFGNLKRVVVRGNGTVLGEWTADYPDIQDGESTHEVLSFTRSENAPTRVEITAVDARGQRTTLTRVLRPNESKGTPEVVRNEFVNGPVDSYHQRISKDRYTAEHVVMIDLNGVEAENVIANLMPRDDEDLKYIDRSGSHKNRVNTDDSLVIRSFWAGGKPGGFIIESEILVTDGNGKWDVLTNSSPSFQVTPSPPEIRVDITKGGTPHNAREWGMVVDASESFDPDKSDLKYVWGQSAQGTKSDDAVGKFDSFGKAKLLIRDGQGQTSEIEWNFHHYFAPDVNSVEVISDGPYQPDDTVRLSIRTESFEFTKNTYMQDIDVRAEVTGGDVVGWQRKNIEADPGDTTDRRDMYVGVVEVKAKKLVGDGVRPTLQVYSAIHRKQSQKSRTLDPDITVLGEAEREITEASTAELSYLVTREKIAERKTTDPSVKESLLANGWNLVTAPNRSVVYTIEEKVKVRDAKYDTKVLRMESEELRDAFVDQFEWERAGTDVDVETVERTRTEWRDGRYGKGSFTGREKEVKVEPAEYVTQIKYEVTSPYGDSFYVWAQDSKQPPSSTATDETRRVKIADAVYETRYEYEWTETTMTETTYYLAEKEVKVQEEKYEWQVYETGVKPGEAESFKHRDGFRVAGSESQTEWKFQKDVGNVTLTRDTPGGIGTVVETRATVTGTLTVDRTLGDSSDSDVGIEKRQFSADFTDDGTVTESEIIARLKISHLVSGCGDSNVFSDCVLSLG